jgi:ADP-ribose diphosphatase
MPEKPILLDKKVLAQTRYFRIEALHLEFSNGQRRLFERLGRGHANGGAVLIVPLLDSRTVLLVREYAAGLHRYELGLPKGRIEPGEAVLCSANRELKEEVGYGARQLFHLTTLSLAPSYLEHTTEVVVAEDLYAEKLPGDEPEELEVVPWRLDKLGELLAGGECTEARSIAALFLTQHYLADRLT